MGGELQPLHSQESLDSVVTGSGFKSGWCSLAVTVDKLLSFMEFQFPHLENTNRY